MAMNQSDRLDLTQEVLREVLQHFVWDEEGDLTREEFDALYRRAQQAADDAL
jgi:Ca2+-binding EF-hand superfamily protein